MKVINVKNYIKFLLLGIFTIAIQACSYAPANVHVITTNDCGASWSKIETGKSVSTANGQVCKYNVALPAFAMTGDIAFKSPFKDKVTATIRVSYVYEIENPIAYIKYAKYLGKSGGSLEISSDDVASKYEMAENLLIDKLIRGIYTEYSDDKDITIVTVEDSEDFLFKEAKEKLKEKGINLQDITLVIDPSPQTQEAVDVVTAVKVYKAAGLEVEGINIIKARAGAAKIEINTVDTSNVNK